MCCDRKEKYKELQHQGEKKREIWQRGKKKASIKGRARGNNDQGKRKNFDIRERENAPLDAL